MFRNEKLDLTFLLLVTLLLSIYLFFHMHVISMDGAFQYIPMAKMFAAGSFREALNYSGQQPLYAFLVSLVSRWVGDFELAARWVSSFFGILLVFPVYFLGKEVSDRRVAFLSVLFLAVHPYIRRFSADALKESTYLFFFATSIWFTLRALRREKLYLFLFVPFFSELAYLVRPDGVEPLFAVFFYIIFTKKFSVSGRKSKTILLLLLSSGLLFLPYLFHLKETTGEWTLSKTKSITEFLGLELVKNGPLLINEILYTFRQLIEEIQAIFLPVLLFLMIVGFGKKVSPGFRAGKGFLLSLWILHCAVLFLLILNLTHWSGDKASQTFFFSGRHVLPLLLVSIYWIGEGFVIIHQWVSKRAVSFPLFRHVEPERRSSMIWVILLTLLLAMMLAKTLKPQRYERLPEKWAGIWIKSQSGTGTTIFTTMPRVAYYADGVWEAVDPAKDRLENVHAAMVRKNATYFVIEGKDANRFSEVTEPARRDLLEVMRYEQKGMEKIIVYKRAP
ncbi:MAG: glycosyltransferase family 39 protein [Deltaproteobacteria bacterium]